MSLALGHPGWFVVLFFAFVTYSAFSFVQGIPRVFVVNEANHPRDDTFGGRADGVALALGHSENDVQYIGRHPQ